MTWWGFVAIFSEIPFVIFWWNQIRKYTKFSLPIKEITKYSFATIIFVLVYFVTSDFIIDYKISIYEFLPGLFIQMIICASIYLSITFLIDKKTRIIVSKVVKEIRSF